MPDRETVFLLVDSIFFQPIADGEDTLFIYICFWEKSSVKNFFWKKSILPQRVLL